jgi:hypothetical protein
VCCFSFCAALVSLPTVPLNLIVCIFPSLHTFLSPVRLEKWVSWHEGLIQLSKTTFVKTPVPALPPFTFPLQGALGGRGMKELRGRPLGREDPIFNTSYTNLYKRTSSFFYRMVLSSFEQRTKCSQLFYPYLQTGQTFEQRTEFILQSCLSLQSNDNTFSFSLFMHNLAVRNREYMYLSWAFSFPLSFV